MENQVLIGFVNPTYKKPISINEFSGEVVYEEIPCMVVKSIGFPLGTTDVKFTVIWGKPKYEKIEGVETIVAYESLHSQTVELSGSAVENWGTDDSEILYAIAAKLGTTITQIVTANINL